MTCQLTVVSTCKLTEVRNHLFPELDDEDDEISTTSDTSDWDEWGKSEGEHQQTVSSRKDLFIIHAKWEEDSVDGEATMKFYITWRGSLTQGEDREDITAIMCLPLASHKKTSHGGPDWTCLIVGFSSGFIRIYTESAVLLFSQLLHEEAVQALKCRTYQKARHPGIAEQIEELTILYSKCLVVIDGFSLYQSLRACRNQVARAHATPGISEQIQPPPLAYKKWGFQSQDKIMDHISCGTVAPNTFDQLSTASMLGGYGAQTKPTLPVSSLFMTSGISPYTGFYYAIEGSTPSFMSDAAYAVASKLKAAFMNQVSGSSLLGGWFGKTKQSPGEDQQTKPKVEPATSLDIRSGLPDLRRSGDTIALSPNGNLAVTTDSFGRVTLIDISRGIAVRMWKGYRDAQVGWIRVSEKADQAKLARVAVFLVIYAPKRGILEVWAIQQGPRVAAFNVHKHARLLCPGYEILGGRGTSTTQDTQILQCCLLDPDGTLRCISVPFHLALSDKNSRRARDFLILKELKSLLKDFIVDSEDLQKNIINKLLVIKTASIKQQALEKILSTRYLGHKSLSVIISAILAVLDSHELEAGAVDEKILHHYCFLHQQLLEAFALITALNKTLVTVTEDSTSESLSALLNIPQTEVDVYLDLHTQYCSSTTKSKAVGFCDDMSMNVTKFISCFHGNPSSHDSVNVKVLPVMLKPNLSEERLLGLGKFMFEKPLKSEFPVNKLKSVLQDSGVVTKDLLSLLLTLWLSSEKWRFGSIESLYTLLQLLSFLTDNNEDNSDWWKTIRSRCMKSTNICSALMVTLAGRSVSLSVSFNKQQLEEHLTESEDTAGPSTGIHLQEKPEGKKDDKSMSEAEWLDVTSDNEQWNHLIQQLSDLVFLGTILNSTPYLEDSAVKTNIVDIPLSIEGVLHGGRGVIAELIAKWIGKTGINAKSVSLAMRCGIDTSMEMTSEQDKSHLAECTGTETDEGDIVSDLFRKAIERFPHSLSHDSVIANCCWEYAVNWHKEPEAPSYLEQAMEHLKLVRNYILQQGVAAMLWHTFLREKFKLTASLCEKVGKSPKDRLCRKNVGMSDKAMCSMIQHSTTLLDILMQTNIDSDEIPIYGVLEDVWMDCHGPTPLVELAIDQRSINHALVCHHHQLATVLQALQLYSLKSVKPLSLYDSKGKNAFFKELHMHPLLPEPEVDEAISNLRHQFLVKLITAAITSMRPCEEESQVVAPKSVKPSYDVMEDEPSNQNASQSVDTCATIPSTFTMLEATHWCNTATELALGWSLDMDYLRRHYVCELYSSHFDKLAEEVLLTVSDHEMIGSQLLLIAGQRMTCYMENHDMRSLMKDDTPSLNLDRWMHFSPRLRSWLKSLSFSALKVPDVPLADISALIANVINELPENQPDYKLALELAEAIMAID